MHIRPIYVSVSAVQISNEGVYTHRPVHVHHLHKARCLEPWRVHIMTTHTRSHNHPEHKGGHAGQLPEPTVHALELLSFLLDLQRVQWVRNPVILVLRELGLRLHVLLKLAL